MWQGRGKENAPIWAVILSPERDLAKMYRLFSLAIEICLVFWAICNCKVHFNILIKVSIIHLLIIHNEFEDSDKSAFMAGPWSARITTGSSVVWSSCCPSFLASHLISSWICALLFPILTFSCVSISLKMIGSGICTIRNSLFVSLDCSSYLSLQVKQYSGGHEFHIIFTVVNFEGLLEKPTATDAREGSLCSLPSLPTHPTTLLKLLFMYFLNFPISLHGLNLFSSD